jgi:hypothetical protein
MAMLGHDTLRATVKRLQLLDEMHLAQFPAGFDPKVLVERGLLTAYQLQILLEGQGENLLVGPYVLL